MSSKGILVAVLTAALAATTAHATTKGLSQIVTPDMQKPGELSLSFQAQNSIIGSPYQLQAEMGVTPWLEGAIFQGLKPGETIFATEIGILQKEPWLLSTGFVNLSTRGGKMQPFLEGGYYTDHNKYILGGIVQSSKAQLLLGWAYDFNRHWRAQLDFESGDDNFSTVGFTYTLNEAFQFNPALYVSNAPDHQLAGYIVLTYTIPVWHHEEKPGTPPAL